MMVPESLDWAFNLARPFGSEHVGDKLFGASGPA